ncbi:hypothetical protein MMC07_006098 [Pseudocyphellaria aurata]|nr:hypothetical protein [Pseudocyphellaria aurata]
MDMNDPRLIVTLEAASPVAERAWNRPQNQDRCRPASEFIADISSRESTPAIDQPKSTIRLIFDDKPKNLEKGFVFGSDPGICDIVLGERGAGFSGQQFCITFNERGEVVFKNTSRKRTQVDYSGEDPSRRTQFTWILFKKYENIKITMGNTNDLIFRVKWPDHNNCQAEYKAYRDVYFEERRNVLPPFSQLGMESQPTTAVLTAQRSPRYEPPEQEPIYLSEEELGSGGFGMVHKVVDVSTGDVHAAKTFHHGDWKKEVDILMSLSHVSGIINLMVNPCLTFSANEHIVKFVKFSEEQKPLLVMEYLPLGNLACQNFINDEETLQILFQGLQALDYLHSQSPPLAHRDIKPANILVRSRMPFVIKLVDFGLAKNGSFLKTCCGSDEYAAPEIWRRQLYTAIVDIWSLGVVVLQYRYGLPRPSQEPPMGMPWCRDIVRKVEEEDGEGDALIGLISTKMLRLDYRHRGSASDCLEECYRLGFHEIPTAQIEHTTPTGETANQYDVARTKSVITQPLQDAGFCDIGSASETTGVADSKRDLRDGIHFYNRASQQSLQHVGGATQIWNPRSGDISKSALNKRRRQQTVQSASDDARGRGQSKRSRASVSFEAGEAPTKPSNSRNNEQGSEQKKGSISTNRKGHNAVPQSRQIPQLDPSKAPLATVVASLTQAVEPAPIVPHITRQVTRKSTQKRTRSLLGRTSPPAAEASLRGVETSSSKRNIHDNARNILAENPDGRNLDGENDSKAKGHHPQ